MKPELKNNGSGESNLRSRVLHVNCIRVFKRDLREGFVEVLPQRLLQSWRWFMVEKIRVREFDDLVVPPRSNCVHIESEHIPEEPRKLGAFAWVVFIPKQISVLIC